MNNFAQLAIVAVLLVVAGTGCTSTGQSVGGQASSESSASVVEADPTTAAVPTGSASEGSTASAPGEFEVCIPTNNTLRAGTDQQVVVAHSEGDMTVARQRGYTWSGSHTATDERFSGTHFYSWDGDSYTLASGDEGPQVAAEGLRIENDDGAWQGSGATATLPDGTSGSSPLVMTGEGAYKDLTAVLLWIDGDCFLNLRGIVIDFPETPVPATSE
jgi:hypothetical protein